MAGIAAQSVGGGAGGFARATSTTAFGGSAHAVGGSGGAGGSGSKITVLNSGSIGTVEINSAGILAQSIGGGGTAVAVGWVRLGGGGIVFDGANRVVQGAGGGGRAGWVNVSVNASIQTYGTGSAGIISHSTTDPIITIVPGVSGTGGPGGSALRLDSPVNQITNAGHLTTMDGAAGQTVRTLSGDTTFTNKGVLTGSVTLAQGGANSCATWPRAPSTPARRSTWAAARRTMPACWAMAARWARPSSPDR